MFIFLNSLKFKEFELLTEQMRKGLMEESFFLLSVKNDEFLQYGFT
jgi:hypothetical protein